VKILPVELTIVVAVAAAALCFDAGPSHAGMYGNSRWCAVTNQGTDCTPAVINGNRGFCAINPY
jgi:hypothetical protein